jgi:MFS transporter, ACS family, glucarate transporter
MYHTYCYGAYFYLSWLHTYLAKGRGFTDNELAYLSTLPFIFGGIANYLGGWTSDHLVKRIGLKWGRRWVGIVGLGASSVFTLATFFSRGKIATIIFLALGFAGSDFMLPVAWAVCLDIGKRYAGAVTGAMNTAGQVGSFLTSIMFGYIVVAFGGNYDAPLIPMAVLAAISALLWFKIDPTKPLVSDAELAEAEAAA